MKKIIPMLFIALAFFTTNSFAQIQKGNVLVGADLANLNLNFGGGGQFSVNLHPKAAFFIQDNVAIGGYVDLGLETAKGSGTTTNYGIGALGRYYLNGSNTDLLKHGRIFFEGNVGISGLNYGPNGDKTTTNGLGLGIGPGYAYFITPNIGLETLVKYNGTVGFGSQAYSSGLGLNLGFQIYLPSKKVVALANGSMEK